MRWDRLFEDLEGQLASEWEAERAALDSESERLRLSRLPLHERLRMLAQRPAAAPSAFELTDGTVLVAQVTAVGADWAGLDAVGGGGGAALLPLAAVTTIGLPLTDALASARPDGSSPRPRLAERMSLGFVLRDLARRRVPVTIHVVGGRALSGTIDRALHDHLDIALHDPGAPRRSADVTGVRVVPFGAVAWVRLDAAAVLA